MWFNENSKHNNKNHIFFPSNLQRFHRNSGGFWFLLEKGSEEWPDAIMQRIRDEILGTSEHSHQGKDQITWHSWHFNPHLANSLCTKNNAHYKVS